MWNENFKYELSFEEALRKCFEGDIVTGSNFRQGVHLKCNSDGWIMMCTRTKDKETREAVPFTKSLIEQRYRVAKGKEEIGVWG